MSELISKYIFARKRKSGIELIADDYSFKLMNLWCKCQDKHKQIICKKKGKDFNFDIASNKIKNLKRNGHWKLHRKSFDERDDKWIECHRLISILNWVVWCFHFSHNIQNSEFSQVSEQQTINDSALLHGKWMRSDIVLIWTATATKCGWFIPLIYISCFRI